MPLSLSKSLLDIPEFPRYLWRLARNLTWLFISLVLVVEQSIGTAFNRFIAKYLQVSYDLGASYANIITGKY